MLRSFRRLKLQPHRATSDQLGGIYPFLAEAGLGANGVYIGTDSYSGSAFVFDPFVLYRQGDITNPNMLVAGDLGTGKSTLAKSLTTRSIAFGRRVYVPGDVALGGLGRLKGPVARGNQIARLISSKAAATRSW